MAAADGSGSGGRRGLHAFDTCLRPGHGCCHPCLLHAAERRHRQCGWAGGCGVRGEASLPPPCILSVAPAGGRCLPALATLCRGTARVHDCGPTLQPQCDSAAGGARVLHREHAGPTPTGTLSSSPPVAGRALLARIAHQDAPHHSIVSVRELSPWGSSSNRREFLQQCAQPLAAAAMPRPKHGRCPARDSARSTGRSVCVRSSRPPPAAAAPARRPCAMQREPPPPPSPYFQRPTSMISSPGAD